VWQMELTIVILGNAPVCNHEVLNKVCIEFLRNTEIYIEP
jgi:hypothetical protein